MKRFMKTPGYVCRLCEKSPTYNALESQSRTALNLFYLPSLAQANRGSARQSHKGNALRCHLHWL